MNLKVDRRKFLRGAGIGLALPLLESFETSAMNASSSAEPVKRLVCIGTYLGFHQADFFPKSIGKSYEMPFVLEPLTQFRNQFSIFSGLDHRDDPDRKKLRTDF